MRYYLAIFALSMVFATQLFAIENENRRPCTVQEAMQAEEQAPTLKNWDEIFVAYNKFSHCDDGAIGEGFSDSIARLLSEKWDSINRLNQLTSINENFKKFVLKHIDELMSPSQAAMIRKNIEKKCQLHTETLCRAISLRLKEVDESIKHSNP